jgi:hypothetical protein
MKVRGPISPEIKPGFGIKTVDAVLFGWLVSLRSLFQNQGGYGQAIPAFSVADLRYCLILSGYTVLRTKIPAAMNNVIFPPTAP